MQVNSEIKYAGLSQIERLLIDNMLGRGKEIINSDDVMIEMSFSKQRSNLILSKLSRKGWLQRLKAGIYRIVPMGSDAGKSVTENSWPVAMELFSPGYIGGWSAAEQLDLTEQIFNTTFVFTATTQRKINHIAAGVHFRTKHIDERNIFGTNKIWNNNKPVVISDIHRTLIDILDDPSVGGGGRAMIDIAKAYSKKKDAKLESLWSYSEKLNHGSVFKRLGFIGEKVLEMPINMLERIHAKCKTGIILLDPQGPKLGKVDNRWGIRVNIPEDDLK
jgi:predicted transcriptional regulator of viral defense system